MKSKIVLFAAGVLFLWSSIASARQRGRFDIFPPIYQQFTVTDWVDVTQLVLKSTIPGGVSGTLYRSPAGKTYLTGKIYKKEKTDVSYILLGDFKTTAFDIKDSVAGANEFRFTLALGDLREGSKLDLDFTKSADYDAFKDNLSSRATTTITGDFQVELHMFDDLSKAEIASPWRFTWNVPFASDDNARISFQGQSVVTSPTPEWIVIYPTETPDLPIEAWVVRVEGNSVEAALDGRKYVLFKPNPGEFLLRYPADAPVLTPGNYAIGGHSIISTSSGPKNIQAVPFEFKVEDPASSNTSGGSNTNTNTGGSVVTPIDPLVMVFGSYATSIPQNFSDQLTPRLRALFENGWTFSSLRHNGVAITASELVAQNILASFGSNWNIYLVQ